MNKKIKYEWKGALKAIFIVAVLFGAIGIGMAVWDDTKSTGDVLSAAEWNAMIADQKEAFKKDCSVPITGDGKIHREGDVSTIEIQGGVSLPPTIRLYGKNHAEHPGEIIIDVINAAEVGWAAAMVVYAKSDTPKVGFNGILLDTIEEGTVGAGVIIDNCTIKDGYPYIPNHTPSSASDTCTPGQICYDSNYTYVCIATNTWERTALSSW